MHTPAWTFVYRHTRLGILTGHAADVVDITDGLDSLLAEAALTRGILNLRSFGEGTAIVVAAADAAPAGRLSGDSHAASLPVVDGRVQLRTDERVLLVELEGPHARELAIVIAGEGRR